MTLTKEEIIQIAEDTSNAYSWDRYGEKRWLACCRMLARRGYNKIEIETIMRSKWTRWAGDASDSLYGYCNSADLKRFLDKMENERYEVDRLLLGY